MTQRSPREHAAAGAARTTRGVIAKRTGNAIPDARHDRHRYAPAYTTTERLARSPSALEQIAHAAGFNILLIDWCMSQLGRTSASSPDRINVTPGSCGHVEITDRNFPPGNRHLRRIDQCSLSVRGRVSSFSVARWLSSGEQIAGAGRTCGRLPVSGFDDDRRQPFIYLLRLLTSRERPAADKCSRYPRLSASIAVHRTA